MIESADDLSILFDPADFGSPVTYRPAGGGVFEIVGIFTAAHTVAAGGDFPGVSTLSPVLTLSDSALPVGATQGDQLTVKGADYSVRDIQPDGTGLSRIVLEKE